MQHFRKLDDVHLPGAWVSIGTFDGVHRGHRAVLEQMVSAAHAAGLPAAVVTFFPHPVVVLRGMDGPHYLTLPDERAALLAETGIDVVVTLEFDRQMASQSAREFMSMLQHSLRLRQLWAGADFALGRNREGNLPALRQLGEDLGYAVRAVDPVSLDGVTISSSQVRALLAQGDVSTAARYLGRTYRVSGPVVHGDSRGRSIGFPTANIDYWPQQMLPANGVYACRAWVDGQPFLAVTNIGVRPTFGALPSLPRVEAHLLAYDGDLYDKALTLDFVRHIRPEQRFASVDQLIQQIQRDVQTAAEVFQHEPET